MNKKITVTRGNPYKDRASAVAWERGRVDPDTRRCPYKTPALKRAWKKGKEAALRVRT